LKDASVFLIPFAKGLAKGSQWSIIIIFDQQRCRRYQSKSQQPFSQSRVRLPRLLFNEMKPFPRLNRSS
jgi:hypothetical protein